MLRILARLSLVALPLIAAACAERRTPPAPPPVVVAVPPLVPVPRPTPPKGSAPNLVIPLRLADGSYATPNRSLSAAGQLWHLRVALNVAALTCDDATASVPAGYNRLLAARKKRFADAYKAMSTQYGSLNSFDTAMTRLYNYFAQPPAQKGFCPVARETLTQVEAVSDEGLATFAAQAMPKLDQPFVDFYIAYDSYRSALASWNASQPLPSVASPAFAPAPAVQAAPATVTTAR